MSAEISYLSLGSNLGDKLENLKAAVKMLDAEQSCKITAKSSVYLTRPVGITDQPDFVNAVIQINTTLTPRDLLNICLNIEQKLGRKRTIRWGPRVIDIDILLYDTLVVRERDLIIPHPRIMERAFVIIPLAEIAPDVEVQPGITAQEAAAYIGSNGVELIEGVDWNN